MTIELCSQSHEFREFLKSNGTKYLLILPYHPSSHRQAESCVKPVKYCLTKLDKIDITMSVSGFLLGNDSTLYSVTGKTSVELIFEWSLSTHLQLVLPFKVN